MSATGEAGDAADHSYAVLIAGARRELGVTLNDAGATVAMDGRDVAVVGDLDPAGRLFEGQVDGEAAAVQVSRDGAGASGRSESSQSMAAS